MQPEYALVFLVLLACAGTDLLDRDARRRALA